MMAAQGVVAIEVTMAEGQMAEQATGVGAAVETDPNAGLWSG